MATAEYETVLAAVTEGGAVNRHVIAEQTGISPQAISNHLSYLKGKGLVQKVNGMWQATGAAPPPDPETPKVTLHTQPAPAPAPRKPRAKPTKAAKPAPGALEKLAKMPQRKKAPRARTKTTTPRPPMRRGQPKTRRVVSTPATPTQRSCDFAIAESGQVLFRVTDGARAGEMGTIPRADAIALYRLMHACEFIREAA